MASNPFLCRPFRCRYSQVKLVGKQRLVLDLSCRQRDGQYWVVTDRWQRFSSLNLSEASLAQLADSCDEFLVHGVDVEGMQLGIDDQLVELLGNWSPIPVTYAGGARTLVGERYAGGLAYEYLCADCMTVWNPSCASHVPAFTRHGTAADLCLREHVAGFSAVPKFGIE